MITTLHLGLSYKCNLSCSHCYVSKQSDILSVEQYKKFILCLSKQGLLLIMYTYGEPLLSCKLSEVTRFVHSLGISQTILTNGWYINSSKIDELSVCGVEHYNVSLDSTIPAKHDANRGCRGAYVRAVEAIRLLKSKHKHVGLGVTVTKNNSDELSDFLGFAKTEHIDRISFLVQRSNGHISEPLDQEYMRIFRQAITGNTPIKDIFFHDPRLLPEIEKLHSAAIIGDITYERWQQMNSCHMDYSLSLEPNGNLSCCNFCREYSLGNISDLSSYDVLLREGIGNIHEHFVCCPLLSQKNN